MADTHAASSRIANNPFARVLKALGTLGDVQTKQGKTFKKAESKATGLFMKLAGNKFYLNFAGRSMEAAFLLRSQVNNNLEMWWKQWRLPTSSDVDDLREQLHDLHGEVEALGCQLEYLLDHLNALNERSAADAVAKAGSVGSNSGGSNPKETAPKDATVVSMSKARKGSAETSAATSSAVETSVAAPGVASDKHASSKTSESKTSETRGEA